MTAEVTLASTSRVKVFDVEYELGHVVQLTPGFSRVSAATLQQNRFNGFVPPAFRTQNEKPLKRFPPPGTPTPG